MPKSLNERMRDEVLAHVIDLHRYANSEVRAAIALLNSADAKLFDKLMAALSRMPSGSFSVKRLASLLKGVWEVNEAAYRQIQMRSDEELRQLTEFELAHQEDLFGKLLPDGITVRSVSLDKVVAAARAKPFQGRLLSEWFEGLSSNRQRRIQDEVARGFVQGATIDEIVRAVRGTKAQNYADGIIDIDRRHAEAVVRSAVAHTAKTARDSFYSANSDLIKEEQWLSTLDNRTTDQCIARDGHRYSAIEHEPLDGGPAWLEGPGAIHWGCRSVSLPVINSAEFLGFELPPVERAAMNGVAPPGTTYKAWLKSQSAARQDDILGPTRGKLLRAGKLEFEAFFNDKGSLLTLAQLRERSAAAFK